jgi:hypothetical protein
VLPLTHPGPVARLAAAAAAEEAQLLAVDLVAALLVL